MSTADQLRQDINRLTTRRGDVMSPAALAEALAAEGSIKPDHTACAERDARVLQDAAAVWRERGQRWRRSAASVSRPADRVAFTDEARRHEAVANDLESMASRITAGGAR